MKKFTSGILALLLCGSIALSGCSFSASTFEQVLNEIGPAVMTILQIIALVKGTPADLTSVTKIDADVASLEKLYTDFSSASSAAQPGVRAQIQAEFGALNSDLQTVFSVAQVSDKATQAKVTALVTLVESAVEIAEAAVPSATLTSAPHIALTPESIVRSYNSILVAKTGNAQVDAFTAKHKIHHHSKFVRVISVGHLE